MDNGPGNIKNKSSSDLPGALAVPWMEWMVQILSSADVRKLHYNPEV